MIKHIILWKLKENIPQEEKSLIKENIKKALEELPKQIENITKMEVIINGIESSNADMMLDSTLEDVDALDVYRDHPEHVRVANGFVRPYTVQRLCLDYII